MGFDNWADENSVEGEITNTLILVDKIVESMQIKAIPEFHILGGAALILNGINYATTLDIDTANSIDSRIREEVSCFVNDMASEVTILPKNYKSRLIPFKEELFHYIKVFTLCNEDLVFTKLSSNRRKDLDQLKTTNILSNIDYEKMNQITEEESPNPVVKLMVQSKLSKLKEI